MATRGSKRTLRPTYFVAVAIVLLFGVIYCHLLLEVNPRLIHHNQKPLFLLGSDFLKGFLAQPGGPVEYVSLLLSQLYHYPWAGALVITLMAALVCLATWVLLTSIGGVRPGAGLCLIPAFLVMLIYSRYGAELSAFLQILVALWMVSLYAILPLRRRVARLLAFLLISAGTYYLAGSGYVLFALVCGILELLGRRRVLLGIGMLICGVAVPCGYAAYSYEVGMAEVFSPLLPLGKQILVAISPASRWRRGLHLAFVLYFPVATAWVALREQRAALAEALRRSLPRLLAGAKRNGKRKVVEIKRGAASLVPAIWPVAALVLAAAVSTTFSVDKLTRTLVEIDYAAHNEIWPQVLAKAETLPLEYHGMYVMNAVNKALYETGRLPYEMFAHPQTTERDSVFLVFAVPQTQQDKHERLSEMFYDLGFVNESEHYAHEALERFGPLPTILRRLAKVNVLKGQPEAARIFLGALAEHPLHRRSAEEYLRGLDLDPTMAADRELHAARARMIHSNYTIGSKGYDEEIGPLLVRALEHKLRTDRQSRTAFEYLTAHYLHTRQLGKVVAGMRHLNGFGYPDIPTHYEEAIFLNALMHPEKKIERYGRKISRSSLDSFRKYGEVIERLGHDRPALYDALMQSHDRTYLLYYTLGFSDSRFASQSEAPDATTEATK